jgi:hypothetical protein
VKPPSVSLSRWRHVLLVAGILLLILGTRIFTGIHFVAAVPQGDDSFTLTWLQAWSQSVHDWSFVMARHHGRKLSRKY